MRLTSLQEFGEALKGEAWEEARRERDAFRSEARDELRRLVLRGAVLEPFREGTAVHVLRSALLDIEAELGDRIAQARRMRRITGKVHRKIRMRIYARDNFTCQRCGWSPPVEGNEAKARYGQRGHGSENGLFLTLDHKRPLAHGGSNAQGNLWTLCSSCNQAKGRSLPASEGARA